MALTNDRDTSSLLKGKLVGELASCAAEARADAMRRLGIESADELVPYLTDISPQVRAAARPDDTAIFSLVDSLTDPDHGVRYSAARAVRESDDSRPLIRQIREVVGHDDVSRGDAIRELAKLGDRGAVPCLIYALNIGEINSRADAAEALGDMGDERAVAALARVTDDSWMERVVVYAAQALIKIGTDSARLGLIDSLPNLAYSRVYVPVLKALVEAGDSRAIPKLLWIVDATGPDHVLSPTARALRQLGNTEPVPQCLDDLKSSDSSRRRWGAEALGGFGDLRAVEPLIQALGDADATVRASAARSLGELGDERVTEPVSTLLEDESMVVRHAAAWSLKKLSASSGTSA